MVGCPRVVFLLSVLIQVVLSRLLENPFCLRFIWKNLLNNKIFVLVFRITIVKSSFQGDEDTRCSHRRPGVVRLYWFVRK